MREVHRDAARSVKSVLHLVAAGSHSFSDRLCKRRFPERYQRLQTFGCLSDDGRCRRCRGSSKLAGDVVRKGWRIAWNKHHPADIRKRCCPFQASTNASERTCTYSYIVLQNIGIQELRSAGITDNCKTKGLTRNRIGYIGNERPVSQCDPGFVSTNP